MRGETLVHLFKNAFVCACVLAAIASNVHAGAVYVPANLHPGDKYRIVFVTDDGMDATSSDIADYNNFVTTEANNSAGLAALHATWTAMLSTELVNILANTGLSLADKTSLFYNTQGQLVAQGVSGADNSLFNSNGHLAPLYGPNGNTPTTTTTVWTGSLNNTATDFFAVGDQSVVAGYSTSTGADWMGGDVFDNTTPFAIYSLSSVLTVEAPEPSTLLTTCMVAGLAFLARKRRC
jgi:hypothetical protein